MILFVVDGKMNRNDRHCAHGNQSPFHSGSNHYASESKLMLICILLIGLLFILCFLGIIKGLIGLLCWPKIGMYGLNLLIDLPRQLNAYEEQELEKRPVVYDIGGWPIHPDTLERSVRIISKRTEFCLNVVFFLAYPLAAITYVCGICFCIKNYENIDDDLCFRHVDVIKITRGDKRKKFKKDLDEERDTRYVINAMKESKESLRKHGYCECICIDDEK